MPRGTLGKVARAGADYRRPTLLASGEINDLDASKLSLTCKPRSAVVGGAAPGSWRMAGSPASRRGVVAALHPPDPPAGADGWAASAPEASMQSQSSARQRKRPARLRLIDVVDDVVARDLGAFERTTCPLWTLPARFFHPEAAPSSGPYCAQIAGATR